MTSSRSQFAATSSDAAVDSDVVYQAIAYVTSRGGPDKHVTFPVDGATAVMGMSGALADHYKAAAGTFTPHASTLDYVVGAAAGCLIGTLRRALAARHVVVGPGELTAKATGDVVVEDDGVAVLKRIVVRYRLAAPAGADPAAIERAHAVHHRACPVSRSLEGAVELITELELVSPS
jgi:uncharacterized OsmC-like protein